MKYQTNKHGFVSAIIQTMNKKAVTTSNIIMDKDVNSLRKRVRNFIENQIKKMSIDAEMVLWKTSVGEFCIYKESSLDYDLEPHKSKYKHIETKLEINPIKGDVRSIIINSKKMMNKDYEYYEECHNCNKETLIDYEIVRHGEKIKVCKECYKFDKVLTKLEKQIDAKKGITVPKC